MRFRPLMGIILFNFFAIEIGYAINTKNSFRPLMGIILFNALYGKTNKQRYEELVSVP